MLAIDYAWWRPDPRAVKNAGYDAIIRYFSHDLTKSLTRAEIEAAHAIGLGVGAIFEDTAQAALGGAPAGREHGIYANAYGDSIGWPKWKPIGYAIDFAPTPEQMPTVLAYVKAAGEQGRIAYGYGDSDVIDALVAAGIPDDWQTCAWSHGVVNNKAVLYQRLRPTTGLQGSFDEDVVLRASNDLWFPGDKPPDTRRYSMLIYADALDALTVAGIAGPRRVGVFTTDLAEAKDAIARGEKVLVVGGPAAHNLGQNPVNVAGAAHTIGSVTYLVGQTAEDTRTLAEAAIQ